MTTNRLKIYPIGLRSLQLLIIGHLGRPVDDLLKHELVLVRILFILEVLLVELLYCDYLWRFYRHLLKWWNYIFAQFAKVFRVLRVHLGALLLLFEGGNIVRIIKCLLRQLWLVLRAGD